jgi:hypothetical protein
LEQVASAKNYHPKLTVYTIVVLTSGDRHKVDRATIDFDPKDPDGNPQGNTRAVISCTKLISRLFNFNQI